MKYWISLIGSLAAAIVLLYGVMTTEVSAAAANLTGTWTGPALCKGMEANTPLSNLTLPLTLALTQTGTGSGANLSASVILDNEPAQLFHGVIFAKSPNSSSVQAPLIQCNTTATPVAGAIVYVKVSKNSLTQEILMKGNLIAGDSTRILSCKFDALTQDSTTDPNIAACP